MALSLPPKAMSKVRPQGRQSLNVSLSHPVSMSRCLMSPQVSGLRSLVSHSFPHHRRAPHKPFGSPKAQQKPRPHRPKLFLIFFQNPLALMRGLWYYTRADQNRPRSVEAVRRRVLPVKNENRPERDNRSRAKEIGCESERQPARKRNGKNLTLCPTEKKRRQFRRE